MAQKDKIDFYRKIILNKLNFWKYYKNNQQPTITYQVIVNQSVTNFIVLSMGWLDDEYHYGVLFHIELKNDKVYIHEDTTGIGISKELMKKGISSEDLILNFREPILEISEELITA